MTRKSTTPADMISAARSVLGSELDSTLLEQPHQLLIFLRHNSIGLFDLKHLQKLMPGDADIFVIRMAGQLVVRIFTQEL